MSDCFEFNAGLFNLKRKVLVRSPNQNSWLRNIFLFVGIVAAICYFTGMNLLLILIILLLLCGGGGFYLGGPAYGGGGIGLILLIIIIIFLAGGFRGRK
jgi:hypothetical protein